MKTWTPISEYFALPAFEQWISLIIVLVLAFFLVWRAWSRTNTHWRVPRLIATLSALIALWMIFLQPRQRVEVPVGIGVLATEGASADSLIATHPGWPVFVLQQDFGEAFYPSEAPVFIPNTAAIAANYPSIRTLHLYGYGLRQNAWKALDSLRLISHLKAYDEGLIDWTAPPQAVAGERYRLSGIYRKVEKDTSLQLMGPFGQTEIKLDEEGQFSTTITFKESGLFRLSLVRAADTIGHFGVQVLPKSPFRTMIINAAPSFESNYLKNWLVDQGLSVAVRSSISKDRYKTAFFNQPTFSLAQLQPNILRQTDLVIVSLTALEQLSSREQDILKNEVGEGLGLLVFVDKKPSEVTSRVRREWLDFPLQTAAEEISLAIGQTFVKLEAMPLALANNNRYEPLAKAANGRIFAFAKPQVLGHSGLVLSQNTYVLQLEGHEQKYHELWTNILQPLIRKKVQTDWSLPGQVPPLVDEAVAVKLYTDTSDPALTLVTPLGESLNIPIRQDAFDPGSWEAVFHPMQAGWHQVQLEEGDTFAFYVSKKGSWKSLQWGSLNKASQQLLQQKEQVDAAEMPPLIRYQPYPLWWFFVLFLWSVMVLWIEEKV